MTNEIQRHNGQPAASAEDFWGHAGSAGHDHQPLRKIHRLLRGRYIIAVLLAGLFAAAGAYWGWHRQTPQWESRGLIELKPIIETPVGPDIRVPEFGVFVATQAGLIRTDRVIARAMDSDAWRGSGRPGATDRSTLAEFRQGLRVNVMQGGSLLEVRYTDREQQLAELMTREVIRAYMDLYGGVPLQTADRRMTDLHDRQRRLRDQIKEKREGLLERTLELGFISVNLEPLLLAMQQDLLRLASELRQAELELAAAEALWNEERPGEFIPVEDLTAEQIAMLDGQMQLLLAHVQSSENQYRVRRLRLGENHPVVTEARESVAIAREAAQRHAEQFREQYEKMFLSRSVGGVVSLQSGDLTELTRRVEVLRRQHAEVKAAAELMGGEHINMQLVRLEIEQLSDELAQVETGIRRVQAEMQMGGRVNVLSTGEQAQKSRDSRRQHAVLGMVMGGGLPIALLLLVGLLDKRYRYSDEAGGELSGAPLLGILPDLPDSRTDPEQAALAAHCVHRIRTMLQLQREQTGNVFAVTSAQPGDGKTSLALALGLSFAASGSRTLLIDCDLVGAGLTARLEAHSPDGDGVLEAVANQSVMEYVRATEVAELSILPAGDAHGHGPSALSPAAVRRLVNEARNYFDVVLVDTGPVLGSIEGPAVAAAADAVVLAIARGEHRPLVEKALQHLNSIGARLAGVVFNRARPTDFARSVNGASIRTANGAAAGGRMGPVVQAMRESRE